MAFWLGADMGTYYAATLILNKEYSPSQRAVLARVLQGVDIFPRLSMTLILPSGMTIASLKGLVPLSYEWLVLFWAIGFLWAWLIWTIHRPTAPKWGKKLLPYENFWNWLLLFIVSFAVLFSLFTDLFITENWLKVKLGLFAITVGILIVVNVMFKPFGLAFEKLISEGSSPEVEQVISSLIIRGKPWIWSIWIIVVLNTALGLFKPF
ncbi:MAG: hypothetical protein CFH01_00168 [Alphaproteobacteria bacterium MarineAlpha2_Bin1]|nr:MAG: hypothetical protein CFH01_00168 [Alphaproteobacteria bacterium MarineAlpha2_Bin1]